MSADDSIQDHTASVSSIFKPITSGWGRVRRRSGKKGYVTQDVLGSDGEVTRYNLDATSVR